MEQRTTTELDSMRAAGQVVARTLQAVTSAAVPGVRLRELDELAQTCIREAGALPSFLGYRPTWAPTPFNGVLCLSPNEVVVHGRPTGRRLLEGDLLSVDCGAIVDGWNGDAAVTIHVGTPSEADVRLVTATEEALHAGIAAAVPGATLNDIAAAVDGVARTYGYSPLPDHGGHGIGRAMHEDPFIQNYGAPGRGPVLRPGLVIAIEPMLTGGREATRLLPDDWTVVTADRSLAAHFEHTVAVTEDGPEVLTARR